MMNDRLQRLYSKCKDELNGDKSEKQKNENNKRTKSKDEDITTKRPKVSNDGPLQPIVPNERIENLPGLETIISRIDKVVDFMYNAKKFENNEIKLSRGIIINGPSGCGKSSLVEAIANKHNLMFYKINASQFMSSVTGQSEKYIKNVFSTVMNEKVPSLLLIDDIDCILKKSHGSTMEPVETRIVHQIATCMDQLNDFDALQNNLICVVINTTSISCIDTMLRRSGRFEHEINIGIPNMESRERMFTYLLQKFDKNEICEMNLFARNTPGFVAADIGATIRGAMLNFYNRLDSHQKHVDGKIQIQLTQDDVLNAISDIKPASMKEGFTDVSSVTWNDVGALDGICDELKLQIMGPVLYQKEFKSLGFKASTGILLYGPPGCGKTLVAKALASEAGLNFISVRGPEILNMYVGESERNIRDIFCQAQSSAPCVIFFDEVDSICVKRSDSSDNNHSARLVNQLLTEMDGLVKRDSVYILGATNRPDIIDPAALRPGRFDKLIYVGLPDDNGRRQILETITKNRTCPKISEVDVEMIVKLTHNFTGADLVSFIRECSLSVIKESLTHSDHSGTKTFAILPKHITAASLKIKASVSENELKKYIFMKTKFTDL